MIYSKAKDQWKWLPNNPAIKNRGDVPEILSNKTPSEQVAETLGIKDFLQKPFKKDTLIEIAANLLKVAEIKQKNEDG